MSHCALIFVQLGCDFGVLDAWKIVFLSRRNAYFWKIGVLSYSFVFHRRLDPKALRLDAKNALNALKNTNNVEIGWIGCTSSSEKNASKWKFGGPNVSLGAPKEVKSDQKEVTSRWNGNLNTTRAASGEGLRCPRGFLQQQKMM